MRSLPLSLALSALAYGIALGLAAWLFDSFQVELGWLVAAVVIYMALSVALRRIVLNTVDRFARGYTIVGGLVLTFVALWLTDWLVPRNGFDIEGGWTWAGVTALVWAAGVAYGEADSTAPAGTPGVSP
jgi:4-amino-4-deoxy-L-arabinose transferase-like glycosyltransferase